MAVAYHFIKGAPGLYKPVGGAGGKKHEFERKNPTVTFKI